MDLSKCEEGQSDVSMSFLEQKRKDGNDKTNAIQLRLHYSLVNILENKYLSRTALVSSMQVSVMEDLVFVEKQWN